MFLLWNRFSRFTCYYRYCFFSSGFVTVICLSLNRKSSSGFGIRNIILTFRRCCMVIFIHFSLLLRCRINNNKHTNLKCVNFLHLVIVLATGHTFLIDIDITNVLNENTCHLNGLISNNSLDFSHISSALLNILTYVQVNIVAYNIVTELWNIINTHIISNSELIEDSPSLDDHLLTLGGMITERVEFANNLVYNTTRLWIDHLRLALVGFQLDYQYLLVPDQYNMPDITYEGQLLQFLDSVSELRSQYMQYGEMVADEEEYIDYIQETFNVDLNYENRPIELSPHLIYFMENVGLGGVHNPDYGLESIYHHYIRTGTYSMTAVVQEAYYIYRHLYSVDHRLTRVEIENWLSDFLEEFDYLVRTYWLN